MTKAQEQTRDAVQIVDNLVGDDAEMRRMVAEELIDLQVARLVYDARTRAGLTQRQLADLIRTSQPVIARLEDADYTGHSLAMLQRIAVALGLRLDLRFVRDRRGAGRKARPNQGASAVS
jgi:ribosome-binding protein aMBF1 (putative translation factor)